MYLIFQKSTETIRQMPENYLIAHFYGNQWNCEPDLACDKYLAYKVFITLLEFKVKFYGDGEEIVKHVNEMQDVVAIETSEEAIELFYGRGCNCVMCTDELSRTLDEVLANRPLVCPVCDMSFELVSIVNIVDRKKLLDFKTNT